MTLFKHHVDVEVAGEIGGRPDRLNRQRAAAPASRGDLLHEIEEGPDLRWRQMPRTAAAEPVALATPVALVVFHRSAQLAPHPRATAGSVIEPRGTSMVDSTAYLSAVAALIGTFVGGVTSIATSWLGQQRQTKEQRRAR
jgi:hypothetical protein